eukprot:gnl/TRDRNA2_/TRDRNA2_194295_c0_seq1.p1 gnl/TRDRNA2_/TRDRNA2_194295_c0~~gnl/TRDRNA2_/TRDRNA2_194295_c0_seq1.p1  ORF type:complete len:350 (-),score=97.26 gnl/TRDRNA2_/TRDRNA2_194295_c0_seq1:49-1098(-)
MSGLMLRAAWHGPLACLVIVLVAWEASAVKKAEMDMDSSSDASDELEPGMTPDAFEEEVAMRGARDRHQIMSSFLKNFARNMKMSVLSDSQGDMPEAERQRLLAQMQPDGGEYEDPGQYASRMPPQYAYRPPRRRAPRRGVRMLNMGHSRMSRYNEPPPQRRLEEQPEAEEYSPPPRRRMEEQAAADEEAPPVAEPEDGDAEAPPLEPPPRPTHHHGRMLNARNHGGHRPQRRKSVPELEEERAAAEETEALEEASEAASGRPRPRRRMPEPQAMEEEAPEEDSQPEQRHGGRMKVRDAMGRVMPLLFSGPAAEAMNKPAPPKSAAAEVVTSRWLLLAAAAAVVTGLQY